MFGLKECAEKNIRRDETRRRIREKNKSRVAEDICQTRQNQNCEGATQKIFGRFVEDARGSSTEKSSGSTVRTS